MSSPRFDSIKEYLKSLDAIQGNTLGAIIDFVHSQFPELDSRLAWNVPQFQRNGEYVFGVSALKNHLALAPWSTQVIENFKPRLEKEGYVVRKNLFQIPNDWSIDKKLLRELIKARLAELD